MRYTLRTADRAIPTPGACDISRAAVVVSSRWARPKDGGDTNDSEVFIDSLISAGIPASSLELVWCYWRYESSLLDTSDETAWLTYLQSKGIAFRGAVNGAWYSGAPAGSSENFDGDPTANGTLYNATSESATYRAVAQTIIADVIANGAAGIQYDDPRIEHYFYHQGAGFEWDSEFSAWLTANYSPSDLGVATFAGLTWRSHLTAVEGVTQQQAGGVAAPGDYRYFTNTYSGADYNAKPMYTAWQRFLRHKVREYYSTYVVPWLAGMSMSINFYQAYPDHRQTIFWLGDYADYALAEDQDMDVERCELWRQTIRAVGMVHVCTPQPQDAGGSDTNIKTATRRWIANSYARGSIPLFPWDCYSDVGAARYYGTAADFADVYALPVAQPHLFTDYEPVAYVALVWPLVTSMAECSFSAGETVIADRAAFMGLLMDANVAACFYFTGGPSETQYSLSQWDYDHVRCLIKMGSDSDFASGDLPTTAQATEVYTQAGFTSAVAARYSCATLTGATGTVYCVPRLHRTDKKVCIHVVNTDQTGDNPTSQAGLTLTLGPVVMLTNKIIRAVWYAVGATAGRVLAVFGLSVRLPTFTEWGVLEVEFA